ncbi:MAG: hypothetical protein LUD73_02960 [Lachnospiraceae bacterium]|nr:hypothetical protein [Lachnospiraceae bacterium]
MYKETELALKKIIDRKGISCLTTEAYTIYRELLNSDAADERLSRLILLTLLAGTAQKATLGVEKLSDYIQTECCLKKSTSDDLALLYTSLFCAKNQKEWADKQDSGLKDFYNQKWQFDLDAYSEWHSSGVYVEARFHTTTKLTVSDRSLVKKEMKKQLEKNPFTTSEVIFRHFKEILQATLDKDFEYYATCEEYYPPVAEDYVINYEDLLKNFCKQYGFSILSCECDGETSDYIPEFW